jgi:hypothetical protein
MPASLIGEVVNTCESMTGWNAGNISSDDDFVEGASCIGNKVSASVAEFYTTALGVTAPYSFATGGNKFGQHFIMWFATKSKIDPNSGYRLIMGNGTSRGQWDVPPVTSELKRNGSFVTRVIDPARPFTRVVAGSWNTLPFSNPDQLTNITQMGGAIQTTVSLMGNFNNATVDQLVIGMGIRLSGGTVGTPDTFETARAADEDGGAWGWSQANVLKGGIYIGPATGSTASVFNSVNESRVFSDSPVAAGFFRVEGRGAGTDVTLKQASISAQKPANARWDYTVGADTKSWNDTDSIYSGIRNMTLQSFANLSGLRISDTTSIIQNGALLDNVTISGSPITSNNPARITNCNFNFVLGHAIIITVPGTYTFAGNLFTGFGTAGTTNAAVYNNSGGLVTLNITEGGNTPTIRNGASATTNVVNSKVFRVTNIKEGTEVRIYRTSDDVELGGAEIVGAAPSGLNNVSVDADPDNAGSYRMTYSYGYTADTPIFVVAVSTNYQILRLNTVLRSTDGSLLISQTPDRQYFNPV